MEGLIIPTAPLLAAVCEAENRRRDAVPVAGERAASLLDVARVACAASSPDELFDRLVATRVSDVARSVPSRWGRISLGELLELVETGRGAAYHDGVLTCFEDVAELLLTIAPPVPAAPYAAKPQRIERDAPLSRALLQLYLCGGTPLLVGDCVLTLRSALCGFAGRCMEGGMDGVPFDSYSYSVPAPELDASAGFPEALRLALRYGAVLVGGGVLTPRSACSIIVRASRPSRPGAMRLSEFL